MVAAKQLLRFFFFFVNVRPYRHNFYPQGGTVFSLATVMTEDNNHVIQEFFFFFLKINSFVFFFFVGFW